MKDLFLDANFPRTRDNRVYHLGLRPGEVANRILTVGSTSRAHLISSYLDAEPKPFCLTSDRGFTTITGLYKGTPISIMAIGMGYPNVDFFVRETRVSVQGEMVIVRLGSCGGVQSTLSPGDPVIAHSCISIQRNVDFEFTNPLADPFDSANPAYRFSKPVDGDAIIESQLIKSLTARKPEGSASQIISGPDIVNAAADSFYSSQSRITDFPDRNEGLMAKIKERATTLEMETHHLFHLARCWTGEDRIRASAVHIVLAARDSRAFITPEQFAAAEAWIGRAVLDALINVEIPKEKLHPDEGSVWAL